MFWPVLGLVFVLALYVQSNTGPYDLVPWYFSRATVVGLLFIFVGIVPWLLIFTPQLSSRDHWPRLVGLLFVVVASACLGPVMLYASFRWEADRSTATYPHSIV